MKIGERNNEIEFGNSVGMEVGKNLQEQKFFSIDNFNHICVGSQITALESRSRCGRHRLEKI